MGCSLYTPKVDEIGPAPNAWSPPRWDSAKVIGAEQTLFYFQLPCSWGGLYSSHHWSRFLHYYWCRKDATSPPEIPNTRSNEWFKSWKRMLIELMQVHGWYMLYPSLPGGRSFSTNFFEMGIHSQPEGEAIEYPDKLRINGDHRFTVPLVQQWPTQLNYSQAIPFVNLQHKLVASENDLYAEKATLDMLKREYGTCIV